MDTTVKVESSSLVGNPQSTPTEETFNSVDEEIASHANKDKGVVIEINDEYVKREARNYATSMKERKKWTFSTPTTRTISFEGGSYTSDYKEVNTLLYQLVEKYFNPSNYDGASYKDYIDPLYIMAISNVEFGFATSPDVLLAPAIPTSKGVKVTRENILSFGIQEYLEYPSILNTDRDGYRGPLQMYVGGLSTGIIPGDLVGSEYTRLRSAEESKAKTSEMANLQYVEGSGVSSRLDGMKLSNKAGNYGDRFNYGDSVNRLAGHIKENWDLYERSTSIDKFNEHAIDNKYSFMAMTAIGHNSTPGIYYIGDSKTLGSQHYWWPFYSFGNAREYCHYLGTEEVVTYIRNLAREKVAGSKNLKSIFKLNRTEGYNVAVELVKQGIIPDGLWKRTCWNHEEKIGYPIQVMYNYFILEAVYEGM